MENDSLENGNYGWNCVALYKITKLYDDLSIPSPNIHVYLAGTTERFSDPKNKITSKYVINSHEELNHFITSCPDDNESRVLVYFTGRISGDVSLNINAMTNLKNSSFSSECYEIAKIYGIRIGKKEEPKIFDVLSKNTEKYLNLLSTYYSHLLKNPTFELTDDDFIEFKEYVKELSSQSIDSLFSIPKPRTKKGRKLLI